MPSLNPTALIEYDDGSDESFLEEAHHMDMGRTPETLCKELQHTFSHITHCRASVMPEKKLCAAIIARAVIDLKHPTWSIVRCSRRWIFSPRVAKLAKFPFPLCCDAIDCDPDILRERLINVFGPQITLF